MPRCAHCGHEFAISAGFQCPSCQRDWRAAADEVPARSGSGSGTGGARPAHLSILEAGAAPGPEDRRSQRRLVSTAGPAVPVLKQQNDSVPSGWTARLEAARGGAASSAPPPPPGAGNGHHPAPPALPPPLKPAQKRSAPPARPAHLLVAQLEADEKKKSEAQAAAAVPEAHSEIAVVSIDLPAPKAKKRLVPDWAVKLILAVLVFGGLGASAYFVLREPPPKAEVDEKLKAEAERVKKVRQALNEGGTLATEGKHEEAIAAYQRALAADPKEAKAERGLGITYAAKGQKDEAVRHLKRYLELAPTADDADEVRANILAYEKASGQAPPDPPAPAPDKKRRR